MLGFTRLTAPDRRELEPVNRLSLSHSMPTWVPAFEQRGEGVFLELPEDRVRAWEQQVEDHPRITALRESFQRWSANRERPLDATLPIPRFLLLQTLSHRHPALTRAAVPTRTRRVEIRPRTPRPATLRPHLATGPAPANHHANQHQEDNQ